MKIHRLNLRFHSKAAESIIAIWIIQAAVWGSIALSEWLPHPIFSLTREVIGFIYVTFIPGILILMMLNLYRRRAVEILLYSVGISIAVLMFSGLFMNTVYPLVGNSTPFSPISIIITLSSITSILSVVCYLRGRSLSAIMNFSLRDIKLLRSPTALGLFLTPFLAIFSTYIINVSGSNVLQFIIIAIFCIICFLIAFDVAVPETLFPLVILVMGISLLFRTSLISNYLTGFDIQLEHQYALSVVQTARWDPNISDLYNSMLSVVMLAPIYSIFLKIDLTWVFKVIYPLLFSLVPLGVYVVVQKQSNPKIAFFSSFFFVSFAAFYLYLPAIARQEIAEIFVVLLLLALLDRGIPQIKKSILLVVFGFSLVVSHYATSYFFIFMLITMWVVLTAGNNVKARRTYDNVTKRIRRDKKTDQSEGTFASYRTSPQNSIIPLTFVLLFIISAFSWYVFVAAASPYTALATLSSTIASSFLSDLLNPAHAQGLFAATQATGSGFLHIINLLINYFFQFLIIIGVTSVILLKQHETRFDRVFIAFASVNLFILFAGLVLPFFAAALDITRLYHLTLLVLSPFLVVGWIFIVNSFRQMLKNSSKKDQRILKKAYRPLSVLLVLYLLFASGIVYQISENNSGTITLDNSIDAARFNSREFAAARWIVSVNNDRRIAADEYRVLVISSLKTNQTRLLYIQSNVSSSTPTFTYPETSIALPANCSYLFLGTYNINSGKIYATVLQNTEAGSFGEQGGVYLKSLASTTRLVDNRSKIYDDGGANFFNL